MGPYPLDGEMGPYPLDGEMGPYPLSGQTLPADGEMGPYPLSDNTNLLGPQSVGNLQQYRNYGSNYGTNNYGGSNYNNSSFSCNYGSNCTYGSKSNNHSRSTTVASSRTPQPQHHHGSQYGGGSGGGGASRQKRHETAQYGDSSPLPIRKRKSRSDSFRRHSAHGRISSPSGTYNKYAQGYIYIYCIMCVRFVQVTENKPFWTDG